MDRPVTAALAGAQLPAGMPAANDLPSAPTRPWSRLDRAGETTLRSVREAFGSTSAAGSLDEHRGRVAIVPGGGAYGGTPAAGRAAASGQRTQPPVPQLRPPLTEMQDGILEVRMVPLGQIFDRLAGWFAS